MTIDKTLRIQRGTTSSRSVLTRVERIQKLKDSDKFTDETSPYGLPKVRVRKLTLKKKKKEKKEDDAAAPAKATK